MLCEKIIIPANSLFNSKLEYKPYFDVPLHTHPYMEILYIYKGEGKCYTWGTTLEFYSGDIFFWGSDVPHTLVSDTSYYHNPLPEATAAYVIHFDKDDFLDAITGHELLQIWQSAKNGIYIPKSYNEQERQMIIQLNEAVGIQKLITFLSLLKSIKENKSIQFIDNRANYYNTALESINKDSMEEVRTFILNNYQKAISIDDLADMSHMNKSAFCRKFKKHFLKSPIKLIHELRLKLAVQMFAEGYTQISEIGFAVGFNSSSYFCEVFNRYYGCSPTKFIADNYS